MLSILRRRPSQVLVALLCAVVLLRMPAPVFAEGAVSSLVTIDEGAALAVVNTSVVNIAACQCSSAASLRFPARCDPSNTLLLEYAVLRL